MALIQDIKVPLLSVNDTTLTVVEISFANGQVVKKGDQILVFETSKTTYQVEADADGYIQYLCETGMDYEVNDVVAKIFSEQAEVKHTITSGPAPRQPGVPLDGIQTKAGGQSESSALQVAVQWEGDTLFSVSALALIESSGMNREGFKGRDFISRRDVEEFLGLANQKPERVSMNSSRQAEQVKKPGVQSKRAIPADLSKVIIEKLSSYKKREIEYLSEVQSTGLTSTINTMVETEGIFTHINASLKFLKNSLLPVVIYETGRLLEKYNKLNAYYTDDGIAFYNDIHVGFAIDIEKGLKVLKVPNTQRQGMTEIEESIMRLSNSYLDDTLQYNDLADITFTVTDLWGEGVSSFIPLINMMNSAILGISSIDEKLQRCMLSLTFDHRVTEGKQAAQFLNDLKHRLESYQSKHYPHLNQNITCFKCYKALKDDLSDVGFAKCITPEGKEGYICQTCLKGF